MLIVLFYLSHYKYSIINERLDIILFFFPINYVNSKTN